MEGKILYLHAITPVHTGIGQSVGIIDLPIARERTTNWPYIPGSSLKGVFREECRSADCDKSLVIDAFGPDTDNKDNASDSAGSLLFCDGHILCLPVRSFKGSFAWVTCNSVLMRLKRDYKAICETTDIFGVINISNYETATVCNDSEIVYNGKVFLEDLDLNLTDDKADKIAEFLKNILFENDTDGNDFKKHLAIVSDDLFTALTETGTDVSARIKIKEDTKTVETGGLWYEEAVPAESIFWTPILAAPKNGKKSDDLFKCIAGNGHIIQIGGHASVGKGIMRVIIDGMR